MRKPYSCGEHLMRIGEEISEQLKDIPAKVNVIQNVRPKYACKPCQDQVKIAPMPVLFLPKSIATPELAAHIIVSKYCDYLPLYRQENMWRRMEVNLSRSSLCVWVLKTAELCELLVKLLQKNTIAQTYAQADETTVQVLNEIGRDNQLKFYMWVYRGGGNQASIVYEYQETRGGYHAKTFLKEFNGYKIFTRQFLTLHLGLYPHSEPGKDYDALLVRLALDINFSLDAILFLHSDF